MNEMWTLLLVALATIVGLFLGWNVSQPEFAVKLQTEVTKVVKSVIRKFS